mgnify:CR=1 FL=1
MFLIIVAKIRIMLCKTRGIVLHTIPYNDKYSIIYMYTEAFGRASYLVSRSRGKKSTVSKALFIPLSVLEMEVEHLNKRDLHRIKETRICFPLNDVCCDPVKNVLALFLSEVLFRGRERYGAGSPVYLIIYTSPYIYWSMRIKVSLIFIWFSC